VLCPCWIGEDPDHGTCDSVNAYGLDRGTIAGVEVGGLAFANICQIPGNVLTPGSWRVVSFISEQADDDQFDAIADAFGGRLGGPLADLAGLVGEVVAVERAPIVHETPGGEGTLRIGAGVTAEMHPCTGPDGSTTSLHNSLFSTVPGSPAYVAVADRFEVDLGRYGMRWSFEGRNAIQSDWHIVHDGTAA